MPEQLTVDGERDRMGGARQDDELAVAVRQLVVEFLEVGDGGDAVIFAAHQQHRRQHLLGIDHRQVRGHVEIGAGRDLIAELQFDVGHASIAAGSDVPALSRV